MGFIQERFLGSEDDGEGNGGQIEACITSMGAILDREYTVTISTSEGSAIGKLCFHIQCKITVQLVLV